MKPKFADWILSKIVESSGSNASQVASEFQSVRQEIEGLIDSKFKEIAQRLQQSFGSSSTVDRNSREQMAQSLISIARKLRSGGQKVTTEPQDLAPQVHDHIMYVANKLHEVEGYDPPQFQVKTVGNYLDAVKRDIMGGVDRILAAMQRDMIGKGLTDLGSKMDALHGTLTSPPLSKEEKETAYYALSDLGRAIAMRPRKGFRDKLESDIKIFAGPRSTLAFDPSDLHNINAALGKIQDPRNVRIMISGKPYMVNLTDEGDVSRLMDVIYSRNQVDAPAPTPEMDALKMARKPRAKGGEPLIKVNNQGGMQQPPG